MRTFTVALDSTNVLANGVRKFSVSTGAIVWVLRIYEPFLVEGTQGNKFDFVVFSPLMRTMSLGTWDNNFDSNYPSLEKTDLPGQLSLMFKRIQ